MLTGVLQVCCRCVSHVLQVCCKCGAKEGQTEERREVKDTCKGVEGVFQACCRCVAGALQEKDTCQLIYNTCKGRTNRGSQSQ